MMLLLLGSLLLFFFLTTNIRPALSGFNEQYSKIDFTQLIMCFLESNPSTTYPNKENYSLDKKSYIWLRAIFHITLSMFKNGIKVSSAQYQRVRRSVYCMWHSLIPQLNVQLSIFQLSNMVIYYLVWFYFKLLLSSAHLFVSIWFDLFIIQVQNAKTIKKQQFSKVPGGFSWSKLNHYIKGLW